MRTNNIKTSLIIFLSFIAYYLFFLVLILAMKKIGVPILSISANAHNFLTVIAIILSEISVLAPWIIRSGRIQLSNRPRWFFNRVDSNYTSLILGYIFLLSPVIYGLFLYFCGSSMSLFYGFLGVSLASASVWALINKKQAKN
jgi:hypothetical protein